ncbi:hypothetical protein MKX01_033545 [Papaver californicum]|nr:hypothetical protein MKX01_033545 [Papaver californicum]
MFGTKTTTPGNDNKNGDDLDNLLLFGELHKRSEKERSNNLLQPISSDHSLLDYSISDPNPGSNYPLYSDKKINGMELPMERATPLFPSLEMEIDPEFVVQREIPILQPLITRFSVNNLESKLNHRPKTTTKTAELKELSMLATPTNSATTQPSSNGPNPASTSAYNNHNNYGFHDETSHSKSVKIYNTSDKEEEDSVLSANSTSNNTGRRSFSASKSRLNYNIARLSSSIDEDRRLGNQHHSYVKPRRQSVSPSMMRGRKFISIPNHKQPEINNEQEQEHASTTIVSSRGRIHRASGGSNNGSSHVNVFASKMVDKVMNARRSSTLSSVAVVNQEREISHKHKARAFTSSSLMINNEVSGFKNHQRHHRPCHRSTSSSSPISNEKPGAGKPKTSSDMALRNSKETREINNQAANSTRNVKNNTHNHSSIRRAVEQSRVCMNVQVIKLTAVTGDKKERNNQAKYCVICVELSMYSSVINTSLKCFKVFD